MHPVLSQLRCWVSSKDAAKSEDGNFSSAGPLCTPLPHFYEETWAYIRGNIWIVNTLPGVKIKALKLAQQSSSRAVPLRQQKNARSPQGRAELLSRLRERSQKIQQRMLLALKPPCRRATGNSKSGLSLAANRRSFTVMVQHEIHQVVTEASTSGTSATGETLTSSSSVNSGIARTTSTPYPVYDGLRSSPFAAGTSPHTWKPYTGPFFSPQPSPEPEVEEEDSSSEEEEDDRTLSLPTLHRTPKHQPNPNPNTRPRYHYTSPEATLILTAIKTALQLPTSGPTSLTPTDLLAGLLLWWPRTRRGFRASYAALAERADAIDWAGAEREFAEESYVRRMVEGWLWTGEGLFGG
ncbi:hypothetical protein B0I37DRAFT_416751 [Chaetomium sp. MPI-CAGE-AT-0009]|nr:hypothetical protein B0I37DRAFT_416751 [Chaetomium sp. MPI-CAGE-AT-0009]